MDRRISEDLSNYSREVGTERRALRAGGDRRRHSPAFRILFIPLNQLVNKLRTRSLSL